MHRLIDESVQPLFHNIREGWQAGIPNCTIMHSHHNLSEIFYLLWGQRVCKQGTFGDLVFRLVMFHQSVEGLAEYPPMVGLDERERYKYCDLQLFKMLNVLMIADSKSYTVLSKKTCDKARREFEQSHDKLISSWNLMKENSSIKYNGYIPRTRTT